MKKTTINFTLFLLALLIMALSIWGPEYLAVYKDGRVLDRIQTYTAEAEGEGYRYTLSGNEKLYILSQCLNSQTLPESEQNALTRTGTEGGGAPGAGGNLRLCGEPPGTCGEGDHPGGNLFHM